MKEEFERWCDLFRDEADDMDKKEKGNDTNDQVS